MIVLAIADERQAEHLSRQLARPEESSRTMVRRWSPQWAETEAATVGAALIDPVPDMVILGGPIAPQHLVDIAAAVNALRPDVGIIVIAEPTPGLLMAAIRAGATDVLHPHAEPNELAAALERVEQRTGNLRHGLGADLVDPSRHKRVVSVVSPRGGTGKTMIAANLAYRLNARHPGRVALVDLDLHFGDIAGAMGLTPEHTMTEAASTARMLDETTLKVFLTHHASGLFVLCAPGLLVEAEEIQPEQIKNVLVMLGGLFDYVVIDTGPGVTDNTITALELSTDLALVTTTHVPSVRALRRELDALDAVGLRSPRRHLVVNRIGARGELPSTDIESIAGLPISVQIPGSRAVAGLTNQGQILADANEREPVIKAIDQLADKLDPSVIDEDTGASKRRGRRARK